MQVLAQQSTKKRKEGVEAEKRSVNKEQDASVDMDSIVGSSSLNKRVPHIPYRDSKLTSLVQDCLGKQASTLFVCTLGPSLSVLCRVY